MARLRLLPIFLSLTIPVLAAPLPLEETLKMANKVDQLIEADLKAKDLEPNHLISDEVFVRRAYLDIVGRIPTPQEAMGFLDSKRPDKRSRLVEELVASPGYDSASFNYFADLLRLQSTREKYGLGWHVWLRQSLADDKPWDDMVYEMLSADGLTAKNPAVGYYLRDRGMLLDNVSNTMQVFLGHQIGCAQCHDHPFDKWTQMEYYELASFSAGIEYRSQEARNAIMDLTKALKPKQAPLKKNADRGQLKRRAERDRKFARQVQQEYRSLYQDFNRNEIYENHRKKHLALPDDYAYEDGEPGELIPPATLFGDKVRDVSPENRRQAFAEWVTSGNDYFGKVFANRLWDRTFGHGLVDPVDNWSQEAETAHPKVLAYLEHVMKKVDFRPREFERVLYHTKLFQRAADLEESIPGSAISFTGPQLRRMRAEEMYDSLLVLTYGNVDDNINSSMAERWESYQENTENLLAASPKELVKLDKEVDRLEEQRLEYQRKSRELNLKMRTAKQEGDQKTASRLAKQAAALKKEASRVRKEAPSMVSMVSMRGNYGTKTQKHMRASEYPTPFKPSHLVRQFGGSDRNIPESSDSHASVPQALTLLNGYIATTTENRKSKTFEALAEMSNAEARLDYLFLAYYGAYPTEEEKEQFLPLAGDKDGLFTLARAMLTSKRFLFVQ